MRFGVCTGLENGGLLEQAGFDYVEAPFCSALAPEQDGPDVLDTLLALEGRSRLKPETFNLLLPADLKVVGPDVDEARQARYLETGFARAARLGSKVVVFGSGGARAIPNGFQRETALRQLQDFLRRCGSAAGAHDITVAIEPLNSRESNVLNSVAEAVEMAQAINHPAVRVLSDLFHVVRDGQSLDETRRAGAWLAHAHVAVTEERRAPGPGDAPLLVPFFRALKDAGYNERISIEGGWRDLAKQSEGALETLHQAWAAA